MKKNNNFKIKTKWRKMKSIIKRKNMTKRKN